jgi:hypothetical protein
MLHADILVLICLVEFNRLLVHGRWKGWEACNPIISHPGSFGKESKLKKNKEITPIMPNIEILKTPPV